MRFILPLLAVVAFTGCSGGDDDNVRIIEDPDFEDRELQAKMREDRHSQLPVPAVDVLWVVDNSLSMEEEQRALANNFTSFMRFFTESELDLDYHIGVVSTGYDDEDERGVLQAGIDGRGDPVRWIDNDTRQPEEVFRQMAILGTDGPYEEKGRAQVYTALEVLGNTQNSGFMRRDAYLSIIVLSDEDDASGDVPISEEGFIDWLSSVKDSPEQVTFSSIVRPEEGCPVENPDQTPSYSYLNVTSAMGGIVHPVCEPSWASVLSDLGMSAAGLRSEFALSTLPDEKTIEVFVRPPREPEYSVTQGLDYTYERARNVIMFRDPPPPQSRIRIEYEEVSF